jgi:hypothetical protein
MSDNIKYDKRIDWLTGTQAADKAEEFENIIPDGFEKVEKLKPMGHYSNRWQLSPSGVYAYNLEKNISQMIDFNGSSLQDARDNGISDTAILHALKRAGCRVTRLDYALDIMDADLRASEVLDLWERGYMTTRARTVEQYEEITGEKSRTVYFGSRASDQYLRVYDKAQQVKSLWDTWLRIEVQTRKKYANALSEDMVKHGRTAAGDMKIKSLMNADCMPVIQNALDNADIELTPTPRPESSWEKWMNEQVMKSAIVHSYDDRNRDFLLDWISRLSRSIRSHTN